jgi:DNA-binding transcriptional LysR family regulator
MNETAPTLDWLAGLPVLLACAREGSATQAAARLGISPATALRRLESLEEHLGVRLFDRTPSGLLPTVASELALPWAEQVEGAALGLWREVQGLERRAAGVVRFALLPTVASWFLAPAVGRLRTRHPEVLLELLAASAVVDLVRREADLAMRVLRPTHPDLVVKKLAEVRLAVVASPAFLATHPVTSLAALPYLAWDRTIDAGEQRWLDAVVPNANVVLRSTELETLLQAAIAGWGALVVGEPLAVRAGLVRVPVPTPPMPEVPLWLVAHRALRPVPRIAAVWDWVVDEFAALEEAGGHHLA